MTMHMKDMQSESSHTRKQEWTC